MLVHKMHACGNDFCVVKYDASKNYNDLAMKLCNRKLGLGADGLIVVRDNPVEMILYNAKGQKELMNGNAVRCFTKYCLDNSMIRRERLELLTGNGSMLVEVTQEIPFLCRVTLGKPNFNNQMIYVSDGLDAFGRVIKVDDINVTTYSFHLGSVNTVIFVSSLENEILEYAEKISNHKMFNRGTNVTFARVIDKRALEVRTYERGIGFNLANGDGCAAAVVAANKLGLIKPKAKCLLEYGFMEVEINKKEVVFLIGPAKEVYSCEVNEEEL